MREIEELKRDVAKGAVHPMKLKQELGLRIVRDFHGHDAAEHAAQEWSRMFQKDEAPDDLPLVIVKYTEVAPPNAATTTDGLVQVRLDKLLAAAGLATFGLRRLAQGQTKRREGRWRTQERTRRLGESRHEVHLKGREKNGPSQRRKSLGRNRHPHLLRLQRLCPASRNPAVNGRCTPSPSPQIPRFHGLSRNPAQIREPVRVGGKIFYSKNLGAHSGAAEGGVTRWGQESPLDTCARF